MEQEGERLSRFLAHAGIASRRHAEALISAGRVQVNGIVVRTQGVRIDASHDQVLVDGQPVQCASQKVYVLLHKPIGYVSTAFDPQGRPTVLELLPPNLQALRVYPVGRLDIDTSGLLILTNDGDFALHMTHPRYSMEKHYQVLVKGYPMPQTLDMLRQGVMISEDDGKKHRTSPAQVQIMHRAAGENCWLMLTIHEGRKRQVRRMMAAVGHTVVRLVRAGIGPIRIGDLPVGGWRMLSESEVKMLIEGTRV